MRLHVWVPKGCDAQAVRRVWGGAKKRIEVTASSAIPEPDPDLLVVVCGPGPLEQAQARGWLPRGTIASLSERVHTDEASLFGRGFKFMVSYSPDYESYDLSWHVKLAIRYCETGKTDPEIPRGWKFATDFTEAVKAAESAGDRLMMASDLETIGLDPWAPIAKVVSVGFSWKRGHAIVVKGCDIGRDEVEQLEWLYSSANVGIVGANFKFDMLWLWRHYGIEVANQVFDTFLVGTLLDENAPNNLSHHVKTLTDLGGYDAELNRKYDKSRMDRVPDSDLLPYAAGDLDGCLRVYRKQRAMLLRDKELTRLYITVLQRGADAFHRVERRGIAVDMDRWQSVRSRLENEREEHERRALALLPMPVKDSHEHDLRLTRDDVIRDAMFTSMGWNLTPLEFTAEKRDPAVSKSHLSRFKDHPQVADFLEPYFGYVERDKMIGTYLEGFAKHLRSDGRFHPSVYLGKTGDGSGGTTTGRSSIRDPAWQTLPSRTVYAKPLRSAYVPPAGHAILKIDYSMGELRIVAALSGDRTLLTAFANGVDVHLITGSGVSGLPLETALAATGGERKRIRNAGKIGNFGLIYGMSAGGLVEYARTFGMTFDEPQAQAYIDSFFAQYPALLGYHERQIREVTKHQRVRSPLGRVRHLPHIRSGNSRQRSLAKRQAINCVTTDTEMLTPGGWKTVDELAPGQMAYGVDAMSGELVEQELQAVNRGFYEGAVWVSDHNAFSAVATPHHRWLVDRNGKPAFVETADLNMSGHDKLWISSEGVRGADDAKWSDDEVRLIGWVLTDGYYKRRGVWGSTTVGITQSKSDTTEKIDDFMFSFAAHKRRKTKRGQNIWELSGSVGKKIMKIMPEKTLTTAFLSDLTRSQLELLYDTMLLGDGCWDKHAGRHRKFVAGSKERADAFLMLCALIGQPARAFERTYSTATKQYPSMGNIPKGGKCWLVELTVNKRAQPQYRTSWRESWRGEVWCPTLPSGAWVAKRDGKTFVTGNSPVQATLSEMSVWAISTLLARWPDLWVFGFTHDSIELYVPEDEVHVWARRVKGVMEHLPLRRLGWNPPVRFTADAEVGKDSLASCEDYEVADPFTSLEEALA